MHPQIRARLNELKAQVLSHPAVRQVHIRGEEITVTRGYLRIRLVLQSRETIEAFAYLFDQEGVSLCLDLASSSITASTAVLN